MNKKELGIAVIGAGRIGSLRAQLAAEHPAVGFLAVSDLDLGRAKTLAGKVAASCFSTDTLEIISRPEVNAVVVSTSESQHTEAVLAAIGSGKPVLVEKPIALSLADADRIIAASEAAGVEVCVAYSRRFKERYAIAKEQIAQGRIGRVLAAMARVYNSRSQAVAMLKRDPGATPVVDALTYYVDLMHWFLEGARPVEVFARGQKGVLREAGYDSDDVNWAILTYDNGAVVNLGVSYALPEKYPALGHAARVEILGNDGVIILDDDHTDQLMYSNVGFPHVYLPDHHVNMVFLQSGTPGDWALGSFLGPVASETRAWLDHLSTGRPCQLATTEQARRNLEVTLAIEEASRRRETVYL